jgi:SOS response regulatory protein OraA/RecX
LEGARIVEISVSKRCGKLLLKLDNGNTIRVDKRAGAAFKLAEGMELTDARIDELKKHGGLSADESAALSLSHRPMSEKELCDRLAEKGYTEDEISLAVEKLKSLGLLDDEAYAAGVVSYAAARLRSRRAAMAELLKRGIDRELAGRAVQAMPDDDDTILKLIKQKFGFEAVSGREERARIYSYLRSCGFNSGDISDALYRISSGEAE